MLTVLRDWDPPDWLIFGLMLLAVLGGDTALALTPPMAMLPRPMDALGFLRLLWQIQASFAALFIATAGLIVSVIANQADRTQTWRLYARATRFPEFVSLNLVLILAGGVVVALSLSAAEPGFQSPGLSNLMVIHGALAALVVIWAAIVLGKTFRFMDEEYVERIRNNHISRAMRRLARLDIQHQQQVLASFQNFGPSTVLQASWWRRLARFLRR